MQAREIKYEKRFSVLNLVKKLFGRYVGIVVLLFSSESLEAEVLTFYDALFNCVFLPVGTVNYSL